MSVLHSLMNILDEVKDELKDNSYKLLCDKMMELNQNNNNNFYKVSYVITVPVHDTGRGINMTLELGKQILQLSQEEIYTINGCLHKTGVCLVERIVRRLFRNNCLDISTHFMVNTDQCECDEEHGFGVELRLRSTIAITKIKQIE
tara:strand:- start:190 stop:627 length:438 start_codon:yes stop_codon:yes gene_type:complete